MRTCSTTHDLLFGFQHMPQHITAMEAKKTAWVESLLMRNMKRVALEGRKSLCQILHSTQVIVDLSIARK